MKQKIGIWGLGIVGKSVINYFLNQKNNQVLLQVMDIQEPNNEQLNFFKKNNIEFLTQDKINYFLENNDIIIPSPGINLANYENYLYKIVPELDIFCQKWKKNLIAFTGSVGKTSNVHMLSNILNFFNQKIATGGNIGFGMLNLLENQNLYDTAILELSSFQLQHSNLCSPDIAVWTNFYPNHLDRHNSLEGYFKAKAQILINQNEQAHALLPLDIIKYFEYLPNFKLKQKVSYFSDEINNINDVKNKVETLYFINPKQEIVRYKNKKQTVLISLDKLPTISYKSNWLILVALCDLLNLDYTKLIDIKFDLPAHRLEFVKTINNINFYNDSKSTIAQSTLEAIKHLSGKPIHLFLGGLSKGVDREQLIKNLKQKVTAIYCFGQEAHDLAKFCLIEGITAFEFKTLEPAVKFCFEQAKPGDQVLFSPSGASYDLFKDYQERGNIFKDIVNKL